MHTHTHARIQIRAFVPRFQHIWLIWAKPPPPAWHNTPPCAFILAHTTPPNPLCLISVDKLNFGEVVFWQLANIPIISHNSPLARIFWHKNARTRRKNAIFPTCTECLFAHICPTCIFVFAAKLYKSNPNTGFCLFSEQQNKMLWYNQLNYPKSSPIAALFAPYWD